MGWSFSNNDVGRKAHIESLTKQFATGYVSLEHRAVGNHLWQLVIDPEGRKFITLDLISKERNGGWGNKNMSESAGPYYYDCPLSLLNKADPPTSPYAEAWRAKVRDWAKKQTETTKKLKELEPGSVINTGTDQFKLLNNLGRSGWRAVDLQGVAWRLTYRWIKARMS